MTRRADDAPAVGGTAARRPGITVRLPLGLAAVALALATAACGGPVMPGPMMTPGTSVTPGPGGDADDGSGAPGGMMGHPTTATSVPHTGPIAGEGLDPAAVATLQAAVDQGAQPWRLDPEMVALAFVRGRFGWMMPRVERGAATTVVVDDGGGGAVSLALAQPSRTGPGGIWAVTGGTWVR